MKKYKVHTEDLNSNRKLIYAVKKAGIETFHPQGDWNGFGYEQFPLVAKINSVGDQRKFNKIKREVLELQKTEKKKTMEEKIAAWARRLVRLYNSAIYDEDEKITVEEAIEIAHEKLNYKTQKINEMIEREYDRGHSRKRYQLICKMERENPLRYIKDENHAISIVEAHDRHTSGYDSDLEFAHELEETGKIEKGTAQDVARKLYNGYIDRSEFY